MKARNLLGFATLAVVAIVVTGFALNSLASSPSAPASGYSDWWKPKSTDYNSDVTQTCRIHVELSEVKRSEVCDQEASVTQGGNGGHKGADFDSNVTQKCKVYIELSDVDGSDLCTPEATVKQGSPTPPSHPSGSYDHKGGNQGGYDNKDGKDGYGKDKDGHGKDVTIDNKEKTTCKAYSLLASVNQCDVQGDANLLSIVGGGDKGKPAWQPGGSPSWKGKGGDVTIDNKEKTTCEAESLLGSVNQCDVGGDANLLSIVGGDEGKKGYDSPQCCQAPGGYDGGSYGGKGGDFSYDNAEKTTCEADGLVALNQCDVGGDANAFSLVGVTKSIPLVGGLLG